MENLKKLVKDCINESSKSLLSQNKSANSEWTKTIMTDLTKLAYDKNIRIWSEPNNWDHTVNEWLYDMVFYESFGDEVVDIKTIHLILESEWSTNLRDIKYDFYKLLQGRAGLRVMIFQSKDVGSIISELTAIIVNSEISLSGDNYLFAGWDIQNDEFKFTPYTKP